jgi:hypothetical protein
MNNWLSSRRDGVSRSRACHVSRFTFHATIVALVLLMLPRYVAADTYFQQTGASIWGPFEAYWKLHGGLAQFGMPRTGVFPTKAGYDAQWFERAMFTYNPTHPDPYKVELQLLGSLLTAGRASEAPFQRANPSGSGQYFAATGHNLSGKLLDYWQKRGGLPIFGYPISEPFTEASKSGGKEYTVQYFERNRLELHPEMAGTPYEVQLGLLGSEMLDAQGGPTAFVNLGPLHNYPPPTAVPGSYPKMGHAPDYSWVAGQVAYTKIQGGCTFIQANNELFIPGGPGWDASRVKNGDYVVIFGHLAGPNEPHEMCPGGRQYIIDRLQFNQ